MNNTDPEVFIENYLYPLFFAKSKQDLIYHMTYGSVLYGLCTFFLPFAAPYGRYSAKWAGFGVQPNLAWFLQECPSFFVPLILVIFGIRKETFRSISNQICLGMFIMHYFQRSFIYAALMRSKTPTPFLPFICAFITCLYNGILHGMYFVCYQVYDDNDWLTKPYFWIGFLLFLFGMKINIGSDSILRDLRKGENKSYKIPKGGWFKYVSCANYFGEIVEMWGYALASCSAPAFAHAFFTSSFLTRRALQHHNWYLKKFENYPKERKAVIPFIL